MRAEVQSSAGDLQLHPAADAFPMMDRQRLAELAADIQANGLQVPIVLCDGMVLDGRNRLMACQTTGVEPLFCTYEGDPWAYVWSLNGARRDLNADQRYLIWKYVHEQSDEWRAEQQRIRDKANQKRSEAAKEQPRGEDGHFDTTGSTTTCCSTGNHRKGQSAKASASKTNMGAVARGDKLAKDRPDLAEKVRKGEVKPSAAYREMRRDEVADKVAELPPGKFRVIYADPPWFYSDKKPGHGGAEDHYPCMSVAELSELDIAGLANKDAVLFLWATSPLLPEALEVCKAWGFKYKAQFVWDKVRHNMGYYNSVRHEFLLICTRGSCVPDNPKQIDSVQVHERTRHHSQKPEAFRKIIDTLYPLGKRIELFCRGAAPEGWEAWGNECG